MFLSWYLYFDCLSSLAYLLPIIWSHLHWRNCDAVHSHCKAIVCSITGFPRLGYLVPGPGSTHANLNLVQEINNWPFTRVSWHGSGIKCERSIAPTPPCLKSLQWHMQIRCSHHPWIYLNGVAPCNYNWPFPLAVIAETLLEDPAMVDPVPFHKGLQGVYPGLVGEHGYQAVKVVKWDKWRHRMGC